MKRAVFLMFLAASCFAVCINGLYAYDFYDQKRGNILKATREEPSLAGENKHSILVKFGHPVLKRIPPSESEKKEIWIYKPFKYGSQKMEVTFIDDKVVGVEYK